MPTLIPSTSSGPTHWLIHINFIWKQFFIGQCEGHCTYTFGNKWTQIDNDIGTRDCRQPSPLNGAVSITGARIQTTTTTKLRRHRHRDTETLRQRDTDGIFISGHKATLSLLSQSSNWQLLRGEGTMPTTTATVIATQTQMAITVLVKTTATAI